MTWRTPELAMTRAFLVLTAAPGAGVLNDARVDAVSAREELGGAKSRWLAVGDAIEWSLTGDVDIEPLKRSVARCLGAAPIDINVVPAVHRRKRLLVADMDSTIIQQECIDEMADMLGLKDKISAITERAMRGELKFEDALRERLGLLKGLPEAKLQQVFDERIVLMPGARTLVATMTANGAYTALVSGGFTFFTSRVAKAVGFHVDHSNTLGMADGKLTGDVVGPILGKEAKLANLRKYTGSMGILPEATLAVGDGANDLDMIRAAGLGVAYRAKPVVAAEAHASITHGDLTALLYLQGYAEREFVAA
jgi:phosphoserine phosphatase